MNAHGMRHRKSMPKNWRMKALRFLFLVFVSVICLRLFYLQVVNAGFYEQLASGQHAFYQELFAERGSIFVKEWKEDFEYVGATNEPRAFIYADPRRIEDPEAAALAIGAVLGYEPPSELDVE